MPMRTELLKLVDAVAGRMLALVLGRAPDPQRGGDAVQTPRRILVIRPGGIGDAVLFIPMLRALRREWPSAKIDLLLERRNVGVLHHTGLAHRIFRYDRFPGDLWRVLRVEYDVVIDTEQYHYLSAIVAYMTRAPRRVGFGTTRRRRLLTEPVDYSQEVYEARMFLDLAERAVGGPIEWDEDAPFYPVPDDAAAFAERELKPLDGLPLVAIHPGASIRERRWDPRRYAALARMLAERGVGVVILGGPTDVRAARVIREALDDRPHVDLAGRCRLTEAAAVVARSWVYVSADSGVLHLAYGVGTPTVHLFGPGVLSKWGPPGRRFRTVEVSVPCSPCTRYGYTPPCNQGQVCMTSIAPEMVFEATWDQLESTGRIVASAGEP